MHRLAPVLVAVWLLSCAVASAQFKNTFSFDEDAAAASGMQLYFDFDPMTASAPTLPPPQGPTDADLLVIVFGLPPMIGPVNSSSFATTVAEAINEAFRDNEWFDPSLFSAKVGEGIKDEEKGRNATIDVYSPVDLYATWTSAGSGSAPTTLLGGPPGNSHNPSVSLRTDEIRNAWPGSPNSQMRINGIDPAGNDFHLIEQEVPGPITFEFQGLPFSPVLLMSSPQYNPGFFDLTLVGIPGSIDLGPAIDIVFDGFTPTTLFDLFQRTNAAGTHTVTGSISAGVGLGASAAFQSFVFDPMVLGGFSISQAADVHLASGRTQTLALGNDNTVMVQLGAGKSFDFYGTTYTRLFVNSNGFLTFGSPSSLASTFLIDPGSALQAEPGLFVHMADYDPSSSVVEYREFGAVARVRWGSFAQPMSHAGQTDLAVFSTSMYLTVPPGTTPPSQSEAHDNVVMSTALNAGSIFMDWFLLDSLSGFPPAAYDAFVGISPGGILNPSQVASRDLGEIQAPNNPMPFQPIVSLDNFTAGALNPIGAASGGAQQYNNGAAFADSSVAFFPIDVGGQPGYYSVPDSNRPDDVQRASINQASQSANQGNPINFFLTGKFKYFDRRGTTTSPLGTVELFDPGSGTLIPLMTQQIFSDTPPPGVPNPGNTPVVPIVPGQGQRDFEVMEVVIPQGALANPALVGVLLDVVVTFPTGQMFVLPGAIGVIP